MIGQRGRRSGHGHLGIAARPAGREASGQRQNSNLRPRKRRRPGVRDSRNSCCHAGFGPQRSQRGGGATQRGTGFQPVSGHGQDGRATKLGRHAKISEEAAAPVAGPMIVRTASLTLLTKDFDSTRAALEDVVRRHRGYSAQLTAAGDSGSARKLTATFRLPVRFGGAPIEAPSTRAAAALAAATGRKGCATSPLAVPPTLPHLAYRRVGVRG